MQLFTLGLNQLNPDGSPVIRAHLAAIDPLTPTKFIGATANANGATTNASSQRTPGANSVTWAHRSERIVSLDHAV